MRVALPDVSTLRGSSQFGRDLIFLLLQADLNLNNSTGEIAAVVLIQGTASRDEAFIVSNASNTARAQPSIPGFSG